MAFDTFIKIKDIPGESTDDKHKDWIELTSFSHGMSQPASAVVSSSGGGGAERVNHQDFSISKLVDKASPKLYEACCKGTHISEVVIEMCRAGGDKLKYMEIKMQHVIVSSINYSGSAGSDFPSESVTFNYAKINWNYTQQKRTDGSGGGNVPAGWDLTANKPC
jgi:type VI secretion system secreted protein Hcp